MLKNPLTPAQMKMHEMWENNQCCTELNVIRTLHCAGAPQTISISGVNHLEACKFMCGVGGYFPRSDWR